MTSAYIWLCRGTLIFLFWWVFVCTVNIEFTMGLTTYIDHLCQSPLLRRRRWWWFTLDEIDKVNKHTNPNTYSLCRHGALICLSLYAFVRLCVYLFVCSFVCWIIAVVDVCLVVDLSIYLSTPLTMTTKHQKSYAQCERNTWVSRIMPQTIVHENFVIVIICS